MKRHSKIVTVLLCGSLLAVACSAIRSTGHYPSKRQEAAFANLPNYRDGSFRNLYPRLDTTPRPHRSGFNKERYGRFVKPKLSQAMPSVKVNLKDTVFAAPTVVWFGHSSYLIQSRGVNLLVDPVLSGYGSPLWFINRNFEGSNVYALDDLPTIDLLLLTHDHYDHTDYKTVRKLRKTNVKVVAPLGMGRTLDFWGYAPRQFREVNWNDSVRIAPDILLVSTPVQHFSGRRNRRNKTLWTSYVLEIHGYRIFIGGDGGYNRHFADIGRQYGPFDLALLENGQYSMYWTSNHCYPEQTAQAAADLNARMIMPVHWAKFIATYHTWNDPVKRLLPCVDSLGIPATVPRIGEPYTLGDAPKRDLWWNFE
jgi:L-ascorbate metabolism protein UlaG (beta-lactamase superfamily)